MDHPCSSSCEFPQGAGPENLGVPCLDDLFTNENPDIWSGFPYENFVFETVSSPEDSLSVSGSDDPRKDNSCPTSSNNEDTTLFTGSSSSPSSFVTQPTQPRQQHQHATLQHICKRQTVTSSRELHKHVLEIYDDGVRSFFCGWLGCKHPVGFETKQRLITHIRSVHLQEKPFVCIACQATFTRKQDANRHSVTMNLGKQYKCSVCQRAFTRKHYRDTHEERCLIEHSSHQIPATKIPQNHEIWSTIERC